MSQPLRAPFLFVFGAAGSGNTFMFSCIARDPLIYGINEDAFASTLERLLRSEREMGKCPHSVSTFVEFLDRLRHDRQTLLLKTPSNVRRIDLLRQYLPASRFIFMIREPHAAIVSGMARHDQPPDQVAEIWEQDCRLFLEKRAEDSAVVSFEELVRDPGAVIARLSEATYPFGPEVTAYATRMNRPENADESRWTRKVGPEVASRIRAAVEQRRLMEMYREALAGPQGASRPPAATRKAGGATGKLKQQFFRVWYRIFK